MVLLWLDIDRFYPNSLLELEETAMNKMGEYIT